VPQFITPFSGAAKVAGLVKTNLANAVVSLFQFGFNPSVSTVKSELEGAEATFDDYVTKTIASWTGPVLAPSPGYQINGGLVQWIVVTNVVTNIIGGYWIENAAGDVIQIVKFDDPGVPMVSVDDAVTIPPVQFFAALQAAG